jgi:hypothetical protein
VTWASAATAESLLARFGRLLMWFFGAFLFLFDSSLEFSSSYQAHHPPRAALQGLNHATQ